MLYVWPLYYGDPELEISTNTSEGKSGCSVMEGIVHPALAYSGISFSGISQSYVDIEISSATAVEDFSITLSFYPLSTTGGTLFHYRYDPTGDNPVGGGITDVILSFNSTSVFLDAYGPSNTNIGFMSVEHTVVASSWDMYSVTYDISSSELKVISNISHDLDKVKLSSSKPQLGLPGVLRVGAPIGNYPYKGLQGYAVCLVMHSKKFGHGELKNIIAECAEGSWNTSAVDSSGKTLYKKFNSLHCETMRGPSPVSNEIHCRCDVLFCCIMATTPSTKSLLFTLRNLSVSMLCHLQNDGKF